ncbi:ABC-2 type transport system ATP-binding protein [Stackebrandtia endophytica]|uniref:ABC-2 type transport system ATP-binding protein n=1 Tax=Stackebrandtia endophytica TaxID=1496996 RepID=A0A543AVQ1_9ACTN|nr:ABC transporter ATP-binding protein [Stackebrandtia endophytica]TQL76658.1 ABC-2 type transport system ATP-binding protein [Stackebrandtia endophytica]
MPAIEVTHLHKRYRNVVAVDDVSLTVEAGEIMGVLGRNGAGKTTTVETIAGVRRPDRGSVRVLGLDPIRQRAALRQVLGVQLQGTYLHGALTVAELVHLYRTFYPNPADGAELIESVGLTEHRDQRFEKLSGGQQQRLSIALALVGNPRAVILDELTTGLDPEARRKIWAVVEQLRDRGVTILLVSHLMEEVERLCDRVALIDAGRDIALDSPAGLIKQAGLTEKVTFRARSFDPTVLDRIAMVDDVEVRGDQVTVSGSGDLLQAVSSALVTAGVVATETRLRQPTLDDAFLSLTGFTFTDSTEDR